MLNEKNFELSELGQLLLDKLMDVPFEANPTNYIHSNAYTLDMADFYAEQIKKILDTIEEKQPPILSSLFNSFDDAFSDEDAIYVIFKLLQSQFIVREDKADKVNAEMLNLACIAYQSVFNK